MPVTADDLDQAVRNIVEMRSRARADGVAGPYAVLLPKHLLNALGRSGLSIPFDVELYPITKTRRASKLSKLV